jgi:uncharacterized Rmd1/YagE family protein
MPQAIADKMRNRLVLGKLWGNMRCVSFATAKHYDLVALGRALGEHGPSQLFRGCLHLTVEGQGKEPADLFFFDYGVVVLWNVKPATEEWLLQEIRPFEKDPLSQRGEDEFTFRVGAPPRIFQDDIVLPDSDPLSKLAVSQGIAQSVKLSVFEQSIQAVIDETSYLPEDLATKGRISLTRGQIRRMMGRLFLERASINLHTEILDVPEFFWEYPEYESLYEMTAKYLDVFSRVDVLNKRLDIVHELFDILAEELRHQHSSTLEWIIIILIAGEFVFQLVWQHI